VVPSRAVRTDIFDDDPAYWQYQAGRARCASDEATSGGGYRFGGDYLVPHLTYSSESISGTPAWEIRGVTGHDYQQTASLDAVAVCFKRPRSG
jgi:hypothetical protein